MILRALASFKLLSPVYLICAMLCGLGFGTRAIGQTVAPAFQPADFNVKTTVSIVNPSQPQTRTNTVNGPAVDTMTDRSAGESQVAVSSGNSASITSSEAHASNPGSTLATGPQSITNLQNTYVVVPRASFTGTQAHITIKYWLTGKVAAACGSPCSQAVSNMSAEIHPIRFSNADGSTLSFYHTEWQDTRTYLRGGSTDVDLEGTLDGVSPLNIPVYLQINTSATAVAQTTTNPATATSADAKAKLGICVSSTDPVDIYWANGQRPTGCKQSGQPSPPPDQGAGAVCDTTPAPNGQPAICGFADTHTHQFANLGFGGLLLWGEPFDPAGIQVALPWCDYADLDAVNPFGLPVPRVPVPTANGLAALTPVHGPGGLEDFIGMSLSEGVGHPVGGAPDFDGWPSWYAVTHQQMYVDWVHRALQGGLKLMVMHAVSNEVFCDVSNQRAGFGCNDMDAVDKQIAGAKALEQYVDSQNGGPGKGWYRIVYTPQQARDAINNGQLAVVLGIEVDSLFNCKAHGTCTDQNLRDGLAKYYAMGARHIFPIHVFNNGFGGAALYNAAFNTGNRIVNGDWFSAWDCSSEGYAFQLNHSTVLGNLLQAAAQGALPPTYSGSGQCNSIGLTDLGQSLIRKMMSRKIIIDTDHMSRLASDATLQIALQQNYPVIGGHSGFVDTSIGSKKAEGQKAIDQLQAIHQLGGMVSPILDQGTTDEIATFRGDVPHDCGKSLKSWAQAYLYAASRMGGAGVGIGSDFNGFAGEPAPRFGKDACNGDVKAPQTGGVGYPFSVIGGTGQTLDRSVIGNRTFDYNFDGMAHIGMYPDFIADLRSIGLSDNDLKPLFRSAEQYIEMWEKASASNSYPPTVNITASSPANSSGWNNSDVALILSAAENPDGWEIASLAYGATGAQPTPATTQTQPPATTSAAAQLAVSAEGTTTVQFTASDVAGNTSSPAGLTVKIDKTAPQISYAIKPGFSPVVTLSAQDALSGVKAISYSLDGNAFQPYSGPIAASSGTTVYAAADDNAGNHATLSIKVPATNLTGAVQITTSGLLYSRTTSTFNGTITIKNTGAVQIPAPMEAVISGLPTGVTLVNASGYYNSAPYITVLSTGGLAPGQSITVPIRFSGPSTAHITFAATAYSGSF